MNIRVEAQHLHNLLLGHTQPAPTCSHSGRCKKRRVTAVAQLGRGHCPGPLPPSPPLPLSSPPLPTALPSSAAAAAAAEAMLAAVHGISKLNI